MDTREPTDAQFAHLSDEEPRAAASNPTMPARVKWSLASIPAFIILLVLTLGIIFVINVIGE